MNKNEPMRLHVYMAKANVASRRKAEEMIQEGRVTVNGTLVTTMGVRVAHTDRVEVDGNPIMLEKERYYVALHKPVGYIVASHDPQGRPLAEELLGDTYPARLHHVGRLDYHSSGLIFFTNDGAFTQKMSHPSNEVEKEYVVKVDKQLEKDDLRAFLKGLEVEGVRYKIERYTLLDTKRVQIILQEGKNREIRKLFQARGYQVDTLKRIRIGCVSLDLSPGAFRDLKPFEISTLLRNHSGSSQAINKTGRSK